MPLKSDFDRVTFRRVLGHALAGAVLGLLPGAVMLGLRQVPAGGDEFALTLMELGCLAGGLIAGLAATAATIVAAIRSRGTGPGRADKPKNYQLPEPFPTAPGPTKRAEPAKEEPLAAPAPEVSTPAAPPLTVADAPPRTPPEPLAFEDFDRPTPRSTH